MTDSDIVERIAAARYNFKPPKDKLRFRSWHIGRNRLEMTVKVITHSVVEMLGEVTFCSDPDYQGKHLVIDGSTMFLRKAPPTLVATIKVGSYLDLGTEPHPYMKNSYVTALLAVRQEENSDAS